MARKDGQPHPPLTLEELHAYSEGSLSEEEEERLQNRLVHDTSAIQTLLDIDNFPSEEEAAEMAPGELEEAWSSFLDKAPKKIKALPAGSAKKKSPVMAALAACLFLVVIGLSAWVVTLKGTIRVISSPTLETNFTDVFLDESRPRGGTPDLVLEKPVEMYALHLSERWRGYHLYRVEILDPAGKRIVARERAATAEKTLLLKLHRHFFTKPGTYAIVVSGVNDGESQPLATFDIAIPESSASEKRS